MKESRRPDRVGVRELRQNLSVYLRRVKTGEALEVTERGHTVARLVPAREDEGVLERLIAEGKATPAVGSLDELPPLRGPISDELSRALEQERAERL
jgi:prevent-host-death family protein